MNSILRFILYSSSIALIPISFAQFTPPSPAVSTVSVDSNNKLVAPTATQFLQANPEIFPTANIRTLTIGTGLSGSNYSVTNATTWSINTTWLLQNYHKNLTIGDGLKLESGNTYNGTTAHTASVDKNNLLSWLNSLQRNFYIFVDMSPTPVDYNSYLQTTSTQENVFYYIQPFSILTETDTANISNLSINLNNGTNVVHTTNGSIPASYDQTQFKNSNITATIQGSITYQKPKNVGVGLVQTLSSITTGMPTYTIKDNVMNLKYWTDCELKVIDKWGNIIYFTSTINLNNAQVANLHPEITDKSPTIWYFGSYGYNGCYGTRTQFTNFSSSIGAIIGSSNTVSGIWIYPNLSSQASRRVPNWTGYNQQSGTKQVVWGQYIREVFENPNNTIIIWRQTTTQGELFSGKKLWRPVQITHYGNYSTN